MTDDVGTLTSALTLAFVLTSMFSLGPGLQILLPVPVISATGNFGDRPNVCPLLLAASLMNTIVNLVAAGEFRRRATANGTETAPAAGG